MLILRLVSRSVVGLIFVDYGVDLAGLSIENRVVNLHLKILFRVGCTEWSVFALSKPSKVLRVEIR